MPSICPKCKKDTEYCTFLTKEDGLICGKCMDKKRKKKIKKSSNIKHK